MRKYIWKTCLLSTREFIWLLNIRRKISFGALMLQTIDSSCCMREWEGVNSWNNEGGKGNPYCFFCPINLSYASPELRSRFNHIQSHPLPLPPLLPPPRHSFSATCSVNLWPAVLYDTYAVFVRIQEILFIIWLASLQSILKNQSHRRYLLMSEFRLFDHRLIIYFIIILYNK